MALSKRCEYALRALVGLGVARQAGIPSVALRVLAHQEKIPPPFLEQILRQLRAAGYVTSSRGQRGGYALAKRRRPIRFGEIVRLIDGPLAPIRCVSRTAYRPCTCPDEKSCGVRLLMEEVREKIARVLDSTTLDSIVRKTAVRRRNCVTALLSPKEPTP